MTSKNLLLAPILIFLLASCEKVVDINLTNSDPQIVIESAIEFGQDDVEVRITRSGDYFEASQLEVVSDAVVTLTDNAGLNIDIPYDANGYYRTQHETEEGRMYTLHVAVEGQEYMATSTMKNRVELMQLDIEFVEESAFFDEGYSVYSRFQDPAEENFYRFVHSINGEEQNDAASIQLIDDGLLNGGFANIPIFGTNFLPGDTITIELMSIDKPTYEYFESLSAILGEGGGPGGVAAPANPTSNWIGGDVLGYFAATSSDQLTVILPE